MTTWQSLSIGYLFVHSKLTHADKCLLQICVAVMGLFWTLLNILFVFGKGWPFTTVLVEDWRSIFENDINELDLDGDGKVSRAEFVNAGGNGDEFDVYDVDNDGQLTHSELQRKAEESSKLRAAEKLVLEPTSTWPTDANSNEIGVINQNTTELETIESMHQPLHTQQPATGKLSEPRVGNDQSDGIGVDGWKEDEVLSTRGATTVSTS